MYENCRDESFLKYFDNFENEKTIRNWYLKKWSFFDILKIRYWRIRSLEIKKKTNFNLKIKRSENEKSKRFKISKLKNIKVGLKFQK